MTVELVLARIDAIRVEANDGDNERANEYEKRLWREVLAAIRDGKAMSPERLANAALASEQIEFDRWYA